MKLTNEMRDDFVNGVMRALPWKNTMTDDEAISELCDRAKALLPAEVVALTKKYPDLLAYTSFNFNKKDGLDQDEDDGKFPNKPPIHEEFPILYRRTRYWTGPIPAIVDASKVKKADILKKVLARDAEAATREETRRELTRIARGSSTLAALQKALPDLVSYMPKEFKTFAVAAVVPPAFVSSLKKAGLPVPKEEVAA